jgi:Uma2 family endonuclease
MSATHPGILLKTAPALCLSDDQFYEFCQQNQEYRIERTAKGEIIVEMPTGIGTGRRNFELSLMLGIWARQNGEGYCVDSSGGYVLPNGAVRSPDASWIRKPRLDALTEEEYKKFAPLCPDFVAEIRSASDALKPLQEKMDEYIQNGALLGLLIDPTNKTVHLYRPNQKVETLTDPATVSCDPEMPGLVFEMAPLFEP